MNDLHREFVSLPDAARGGPRPRRQLTWALGANRATVTGAKTLGWG